MAIVNLIHVGDVYIILMSNCKQRIPPPLMTMLVVVVVVVVEQLLRKIVQIAYSRT